MGTRHVHALVIGCGAVGSACAFRLAERGLSVMLLDRAPAPAAGSSSKSAGGIRAQFSSAANVAMSLLSLECIDHLSQEYGEDVGYRAIGYLLLIPEEHWDDHLHTVEKQRKLGAQVEVIQSDRLQDLVSLETNGLAGASFGPADGILDPHWLVSAQVRLARRHGASIMLGQSVTEISRSETHWQVSTQDGTTTSRVTADLIVNAAGPWAGQIGDLAGLSVPVSPKRTMILLSDEVGEKQRQLPMIIDTSSGFYLRSEGHKLLFGRSNPNQSLGFHSGMDWPWLEHVLQPGVERFPWLADVGVDTRGSWWGYYEMTPDSSPIIGEHPDTLGDKGPRWIDACGFSGHGVMHSLATGLLVAEIAEGDTSRSVDTTPFRHGRFEQRNNRELNVY